MVRVLLEGADKPIAFGELLDTVAVHATIFEFTLVTSLVGPHHHSLTVHVVLNEVTLVDLSRISKVVFAFTVELAIDEVALVVAAIELKSSFAGLSAFDEVTCVDDLASVPHLNSDTMLTIMVPIAII